MSDSTDLPAHVAFRHPDFRLYVASWWLANVGAQMLAVAVGWQVYAMTHRALDLGYVGLVQFLPALALSLPAGQLADRVDRARIVGACNLALAACAAALLFLARSHASVGAIYAVLLVVGVARACVAPAGEALAPGLVPAEHLPSAIAWTSTAWQAATILGPAFGGVLYSAAGGASWTYAACVAAFGGAAAFAFAIAPRSFAAEEEESGSPWSRVLAGLRFVRRQPVILESVSLDLFAVLFGGASALLPVFASDVLHVGPWGLGVLRSAPAVGATAMAVVLAHRPLVRRAGPTMLACVALFGVATVVFGLSHNFVLSAVCLATLGASDMVSVVVRATVVQLRTPPAMRGRVSAVSMLFIATSSDLGELESGLTAAWLGAVPAVVLGGLGTVLVVAVFAFGFGALRRVDRLDETEGSAPQPAS